MIWTAILFRNKSRYMESTNMRKQAWYTTLSIIFVIAVFAVALLAVLKGPDLYYSLKYREEKFIGCSSQEIEEEYGKFDISMMPRDEDGLYRNCRCGYMTKERRPRLFGYDPPEYYMISFNENGIAVRCEFDIGGWGG